MEIEKKGDLCREQESVVFFFCFFFVRVVGGRGVGEDAEGSLGMMDAIGRGNARVEARREKW